MARVPTEAVVMSLGLDIVEGRVEDLPFVRVTYEPCFPDGYVICGDGSL